MSDSWQRVAAEDFDAFAGRARRALVEIDYRLAGRDQRLELPVLALGQGRGPTLLVCGGTHGDEYEGQWTAAALCRELDPDQVAGRLIIVPTVNRPAALAGRRTSPLDGADINRVFPPRPEAEGPSAAIARFLWDKAIRPCDLLLDLHSGGGEHEFVLSSNLQGRLGSTASAEDLAALLAMDAPYAIVFDEVPSGGGEGMPHGGTIEGAARAIGKRCFSSERGGGGRLTPESVAAARAATLNLLRHVGVLRGPAPGPGRSRLLVLARPEHYLASPVAGLFAPAVRLGEAVRAGQALGAVCRLEEPGFPLHPVAAACDGVVVALAAQARVAAGGTLAMIAEAP
jgi:predicted deacylase